MGGCEEGWVWTPSGYLLSFLFRYLLCYFFHPPVLSFFILSHFFVLPWIFVICKCKDACVQQGWVLSCQFVSQIWRGNLNLKVQYCNNWGYCKEEESCIVLVCEADFFSVHAITEESTALARSWLCFWKKDRLNKKNCINVMLQFYLCILHGSIDWKTYFEFQGLKKLSLVS